MAGTPRIIANVQSGGFGSFTTQADSAQVVEAAKILRSTQETVITKENVFSISGTSGFHVDERASKPGTFQLTMEPGATYTLNASGSVNDIGMGRGGKKPDEIIAGRQTKWVQGSGLQVVNPGQTALQAQIVKPDGTIETMNYAPGMSIKADAYPPGSKLSATYVEKGSMGNNTGAFDLSVTEAVVRSKVDQTTKIETDRLEKPQVSPSIVADNAPPAAFVPAPKIDAANPSIDRVLKIEGDRIATTGGYAIKADGNSGMTITTPDLPDAKSSTIRVDFAANRITSGKNVIALDSELKDATYVLGDGAQIKFRRSAEGHINGYDVASLNARAGVSFDAPPPGAAAFGEKANVSLTGDGREWLVKNAEARGVSMRLVGLGDAAPSERPDLQLGWLKTNGTAPDSSMWLTGVVHDQKTGAVSNTGVKTDLALQLSAFKPALGTQAYNDALNNSLNAAWGERSGEMMAKAQASGVTYDPSKIREDAWAYLKPARELTAAREAQSTQLRQELLRWSALTQDPTWAQLCGGWPNHFSSAPQGLEAVMLMFQLFAMQQQQSTSLNYSIPRWG